MVIDDGQIRPYYPKPEGYAPTPEYPEGHKRHGSKRCIAWNSHAGRQCMGLAVTGRRVCYMHGGASPSGMAHPSYKTGRYTKDLPSRLAGNFELSVNDPELISLRDEISLIDARTNELIQKIDIAESGVAWIRLKSAMELLLSLNRQISALNPDDQKRIALVGESRDTLNRIKTIIDEGVGEWATWDEIRKNVALRKDLAEGERRRLIDMQSMITTEQAIMLVTALTRAVIENVTDKNLRSKIQRSFDKIVNRQAE